MSKRIVFICEANSTRSQLAEGLARKYLPSYISESAGSVSYGGINPLVSKILFEEGVDCSIQYPKEYTQIRNPESVNLVVILCARDFIGNYFLNAHKIHLPMNIPGVGFAHGGAHILDAYRQLAEEIKGLLTKL
jgi:arsenate reductase